MAMEFDPDATLGEPQRPYLDIQTGRIIWVWELDEDYADTVNADPAENRRNRVMVEAQPDRFVEFPGSCPIDDNEMMRDFLCSHWTDDEALRQRASDAYHGSIRRWKNAIGHDPTIMHAWRQFESNAIHEQALAFLTEHGIEPTETVES